MDFDRLTLCAFRYCLPRASYVVSDMCDHIRENYKALTPNTQNIIIDEIQWSIKHELCGDEIDEMRWISLLETLTLKDEE